MKTRTIALIALAGLGLAACSGRSDEPQPANETVVANIVEPENFTNVTTETAPPPVAANVTSEAPPTAELAPDEQTQDDAAATGMTARVDRNSSDEGQPAQQ
jgi:hypothetical protein